MRRRALSVAAAVAVSVGVLAAVAQAIVPPAGTPDLSQMAIAPSDLALGAKVAQEGYVVVTSDYVAGYDRAFETTATQHRVALYSLDSRIVLATSRTTAVKAIGGERTIFGSKLGRTLLASALIAEIRKHNGITLKDVRFAKLRSLGVGDDSFVQALTLRYKRYDITADLVVVRVGAVVGTISTVLIQPGKAQTVARQLAAAVVGHITSVLAAGSTGPTGATGATGATG